MIDSVGVFEMQFLEIGGPDFPLEIRRWNVYYTGGRDGPEYRYEDVLPCATLSLSLSSDLFVLCKTLFCALPDLEIEESDHHCVISQFMSFWRTAGSGLVVPACLEVRVVCEPAPGDLENAIRQPATEVVELGRRMSGMVPASIPAIRALGSAPVSWAGMGCAVCLEELEVGSEATRMPCSHLFHWPCIARWLLRSHYCPACRHEMPTA